MKAYTSIEQSKKLAEILPLESADMCWNNKPDNVPCWSLSALLSIIPDVSLNSFKDGGWNVMINHDGKMIYTDKKDPVDACYEMILKLHEQNIL